MSGLLLLLLRIITLLFNNLVVGMTCLILSFIKSNSLNSAVQHKSEKVLAVPSKQVFCSKVKFSLTPICSSHPSTLLCTIPGAPIITGTYLIHVPCYIPTTITTITMMIVINIIIIIIFHIP